MGDSLAARSSDGGWPQPARPAGGFRGAKATAAGARAVRTIGQEASD
jgi:hypothetical protein